MASCDPPPCNCSDTDLTLEKECIYNDYNVKYKRMFIRYNDRPVLFDGNRSTDSIDLVRETSICHHLASFGIET